MDNHRKVGIQTRPTFARVSGLGFLILVLWLGGAGGVMLVLGGENLGWLMVGLAVAFGLIYPTQRFKVLIYSAGSSSSYPARAFIGNTAILILLAYLAGDYLSDPFVTYNSTTLKALVYAVIGALLALGAFIANLIAYGRDRKSVGTS